jgi:hypothetical protein
MMAEFSDRVLLDNALAAAKSKNDKEIRSVLRDAINVFRANGFSDEQIFDKIADNHEGDMTQFEIDTIAEILELT